MYTLATYKESLVDRLVCGPLLSPGAIPGRGTFVLNLIVGFWTHFLDDVDFTEVFFFQQQSFVVVSLPGFNSLA